MWLLMDGAEASDDESDDGVSEAEERKEESAVTDVDHDLKGFGFDVLHLREDAELA